MDHDQMEPATEQTQLGAQFSTHAAGFDRRTVRAT